MARPRPKSNSRTFKKWISEGRGQGHGQNYVPWLKVQNVPSNGYVHRILGWKTGRRHEFMSNHEANYFYLLEWSPLVSDVREQYPLLPIDETISLAREYGIKHPTDPRTGSPIVMTTDFLVDVRQNGSMKEIARTIKPSKELFSDRVLQKFEIERRFWSRRGVGWGVVTEENIAPEMVRNIQWIHPYLEIRSKFRIPPVEVDKAARVMSDLISQGLAVSASASVCDDRLGFVPGIGLALIRHFLATRRWSVDMTKLINPQQPITLLNN